jgi:hypothetical protein
MFSSYRMNGKPIKLKHTSMPVHLGIGHLSRVMILLPLPLKMPRAVVDSRPQRRYDIPVFRLAGRSRSQALSFGEGRGIEESPYSTERGAGETPGWRRPSRGNLSDQGHRNRLPPPGGEGEKAVQETTGVRSNAAGQATPTGSKAKQGREAARFATSPG